jgi:hypothetical protein
MICKRFRLCSKKVIKKITDKLIDNVELCIEVTTKLKSLIDSNVTVTITDLIPGYVDNTIRVLLSNALASALKALGFIKEAKDLNDHILTEFRNSLSAMPEAVQDAVLQKTASFMSSTMDNNKEIQSFYDSVTQATYTALKMNHEAEV